MDEQRRQELADIIGTLETRQKHYEAVYERKEPEQMARAFVSLFNDFDYALHALRALRDNGSFDQETDDEE
jgi:hypothetical protein